MGLVVETESQNDPETNGVVVVRRARGNIRIEGDANTSEGPWAMIVDGDLDVTGDLECRTGDYLVSTLIVTGSVRARNLSFHTSARIGIEGDLIVEGVVVGTHGDSDACLTARTIEARMVALDDHTSVSVDKGGPIDAIVKGSPGWRHLDPDLHGDLEVARLFVPEVLQGNDLDLGTVWTRACAGQLPMLPEAERQLRARKGLPPLEALAALATDPRAREIVAAGGTHIADVLCDRLEELGHVVVRERLAAYLARRATG